MRAIARLERLSFSWLRAAFRCGFCLPSGLSAGRLVPGMLILPLMIAFNDSGPYSDEWASLVVLLVFMFSVCLAAVSLGVLMFAWLGRTVWAVVITAVVWGISISDWLALGTVSLLGWESVNSVPSLPFSGVAKLCLWA